MPNRRMPPIDDGKARIAAYMANFERNRPLAIPAEKYTTVLNPGSEVKFRQWVKANNVPFDPNAEISDYDMRGFWQALQLGDKRARQAINANDGLMHFSDYWKTPYHQSFNRESQWANPQSPHWNELDQLISPLGKVVFDERKLKRAN